MKVVILDRDGVINKDSHEYVKSPSEFILLPNSLTSIARLNKAGFKVLVITNQSGVGRKLFNETTLNLIHAKLSTELASVDGLVDKFYYCPHTDSDLCDCRKPKPGLFKGALKDYSVTNPESIFAVGDSLRDLQAAAGAGCTPVLVKTGNGCKTLEQLPEALTATPVFEDLRDFVDWLLR